MRQVIVLYMVCSIILLHQTSGNNYILQENALHKNNALFNSAEETDSNRMITKAQEETIIGLVRQLTKDDKAIGMIKQIIESANKTLVKGGSHANTTLPLGVGLSDGCMDSLKKMFLPGLDFLVNKDIEGFKKWIKKDMTLIYYIDAWGKIPTTVLYGDAFWYGGYKECQAIPTAHYCLADMVLLSNPALSGGYGSCVPRECNQNDVFYILHKSEILKKVVDFPANGTFKATYGSAVVCNDRKVYPTDTVVLLCLIGVLVTLCIVGTLIDGFQNSRIVEFVTTSNVNASYEVSPHDKENGGAENGGAEKVDAETVSLKRESKCANFFTCFSLLKNVSSLLATHQPRDAITSINGIRAISISWVILGHVYFYGIMNKLDNPKAVIDIGHRFTFQAVANAYVSVDSFFCLSGLLVSYLALKRMEKMEGKLNVPMFYLHRFLRLTPSYMFIIFVFASLFPEILDSPEGMLRKTRAQDVCRESWWANLLYIQNFYPDSGKMCLGWSWYLANDMQFYIISPLYLYVFYKFKLKCACILTAVSLLLCAIVNAVTSVAYDLPSLLTEIWVPNSHSTMTDGLNFFDIIYDKPYTRIGPYVVGLFLGFLLRDKKNIFESRKKAQRVVLGWVCAIICGMLVIYGPYTAYQEGGKPFGKLENALYNAFSRIGWGMALAWVIYACHYKAGGIINSFLSWSAWVPLSRLTFGAYLWHPMVLMYYYRGSELPIHYQDGNAVYIFVASLGLSYSLAFIVAVLIDLPVTNLEKKAFGG